MLAAMFVLLVGLFMLLVGQFVLIVGTGFLFVALMTSYALGTRCERMNHVDVGKHTVYDFAFLSISSLRLASLHPGLISEAQYICQLHRLWQSWVGCTVGATNELGTLGIDELWTVMRVRGLVVVNTGTLTLLKQ